MRRVSYRSLFRWILAVALVTVLASVAATQPPKPKEIIPTLRMYAVSGLVVTSSEGTPVGNVAIGFVSVDDGKTVATAFTDAQGQFVREGLAFNQHGYKVIPKSSGQFSPKEVTVTGPTSGIRFVLSK